MPESNVSFEKVSVATEKREIITIRSNGGAAYQILDAIVQNAGDKWRIDVSPELTVAPGLRPAGTATIAVFYRPCPDAWNGNTLKDGYDFTSNCTTMPDSVDLVITDNTVGESQTRTITLTGQPVFPPNVTAFCSRVCNDPDPQYTACNTLLFGTVNSGDTPCDIEVQLRNSWRMTPDGNSAEVGHLEVERLDVSVRDQSDGNQPLLSGREAGFSFLTTDGSTLAPDSDNPFLVTIPPGSMEGRNSFFIRFTGEREGQFFGNSMNGEGVRITTSDPDNPVVALQLTATGAAPNCQNNPADDTVRFVDVDQGTTATSSVTYTNFGTAPLTIEAIQVNGPGNEVTITTSRGNPPFTLQPTESFEPFITYSPIDTGADIYTIDFTTDPALVDPLSMIESPYCQNLTVRGGNAPQIDLQPNDVLSFQPGGERCQTQRVCNIGSGDLMVTQIELLGPDMSPSHPSVDDFTITMPAACGTLPCNPGFNLCPPTRAGCMDPCEDMEICYANNDVSSTDLANMVFTSNDPASPMTAVVLDAADDPCLTPAPVITVETAEPCVGQPVMVSATASNPGGAMGGGGTIVAWSWDFLFASPVPNYMPPDTESTLFIPEGAGLHILNLDVINDCGAMSQTPGQEQILVAATCD